MSVKYTINKDVLVISIDKDIDHYATELLRNNIDRHINESCSRYILFNLNNVEFMDSSSIGLIIGRYKQAKMTGKKMAIICDKESLKKILILSGIGRIIKIYDSLEIALISIREEKK